MSEFLTKSEINQFNKDGAIFIKGKFDVKSVSYTHLTLPTKA